MLAKLEVGGMKMFGKLLKNSTWIMALLAEPCNDKNLEMMKNHLQRDPSARVRTLKKARIFLTLLCCISTYLKPKQ